MKRKILVINPGSTSTKIAVFEDETLLMEEIIRHKKELLQEYRTIYDQKDFRMEMIRQFLEKNDFDIMELSAVVGRGGLVKPVESGTYIVTEKLRQDLKEGIAGQHASNLGGELAREIADCVGVPAYIVDPTVVDEMIRLAKYTGMPEIERTSIFHALNQKAVGRRFAKSINTKYDKLNLIIAHLGGGISIGAHCKGKVIDVNNCLDGDGCFSPERSGSVPVGELVKMCFSGEYTKEEIYSKILGKGGVVAYLGTNDCREAVKREAEGDKKAGEVIDAFVYQISKDIGALGSVLEGKVDQIILTGGIAYSERIVESIISKVDWIAPVTVYPGEDEMLSLAQGALRVMNGEETPMEY